MYALCFLLPSFLSAGVFAQSLGIFLCWFLPCLGLVRKKNYFSISKSYWYIALFLAGIWFLFPVFSIVHEQFIGTASKVPFRSLLKSHIPSTVPLTAFGLSFLYFLSQRLSKKNKVSFDKINTLSHTKMLTLFINGFIASSLILGSYILVQYLTGYDYRSIDNKLDPSYLMQNGFYRCVGFYGHPLSLASCCLVIIVLFSLLLGNSIRFSHIPYLKRKSSFIIFVHIMVLLASASRTAIAIASVFLCFYFAYTNYQARNNKKTIMSFLIFLNLLFLSSTKIKENMPRFLEPQIINSMHKMENLEKNTETNFLESSLVDDSR